MSSTYAKPNRGHVRQLKEQLKKWTKDNKSIGEYFQGFTTRFDYLAILGKAIDHDDQVEFILEGLPDEYKTVVDQIKAHDNPPSLTKVHKKLLNIEIKLQAAGISMLYLPITANVAHYNGPNQYKNQQRLVTKGQKIWQQ